MQQEKLDKQLDALLNKHFGGNDWTGVTPPVKQYKLTNSEQKEYRVEKNDAIQSAIRVGRLIVPKRHEDYCGLMILNTILGGYFSSRLMANIREEKGYTYGIGSSLINLNEAAFWVIATETDQKV